MHKLHFSVDIKAPKEKVWLVLWDDASFRDWASIFTEGSYIKSEWKEGGRFEFFDSSSSDGSYGVIEKLIPNEYLFFKHLGRNAGRRRVPIRKTQEGKLYTQRKQRDYNLNLRSGYRGRVQGHD